MLGGHFTLLKSKTIDNYVTGIRKIAALFRCGEPEALEVFKNTLQSRLYWVLFPTEN